jgi:hypothetical protein
MEGVLLNELSAPRHHMAFTTPSEIDQIAFKKTVNGR